MHHARKIGLSSEYGSSTFCRRVIHQMMSLPLLPDQHITQTFNEIAQTDSDATILLRNFMAYVNRQWIHSTVHPVSSWCVHSLSTRTNNDQQGYHSRLNNMMMVIGIYLDTQIILYS